jgi:tetratricopeptide (TPR) repeat protein
MSSSDARLSALLAEVERLLRARRATDAEPILRRALQDGAASCQQQSQRAALQHYMGVCLKLQRRYADALTHLDSAVTLAPHDPQIQTSRAVVLQHLQRFDDAIAAYERLLAQNPLDMESHLQLNELLYRQGRDHGFLGSYDVAARQIPTSPIPLATKGQFLLKLGRAQDALEAFERALRIAPQRAATLTGMARSLEALGDRPAASACFRRSVALQPHDSDVLVACAGFLLRSDDARGALDMAARAHALQPADQAALALLGLCYRARSDTREDQLNDYGSLVQIFDLDPPDGHADMATFNRDLADYLDALHADTRENFSQTLRGGTRLYDEIFYNGHALVDRLHAKIDDAVRRYISGLRPDASQPFTSRRTSAYSYTGSWSSRLCGSGFHVNHIHPAGWISSAYYVAVPEAAADRIGRPGWLKFGEPSDDFGTGFPPRLSIQPKPGRLVLFPSYLWHGTVPYSAAQNRTTIAFDVVPR